MSATHTTHICPGDYVKVRYTRGQATFTPTTEIVEGHAYLDEEGTLRVGRVNLTRDDQGYFRNGVLPLVVVNR
jgi:hypothetical protein